MPRPAVSAKMRHHQRLSGHALAPQFSCVERDCRGSGCWVPTAPRRARSYMLDTRGQLARQRALEASKRSPCSCCRVVVATTHKSCRSWLARGEDLSWSRLWPGRPLLWLTALGRGALCAAEARSVRTETATRGGTRKVAGRAHVWVCERSQIHIDLS